MKDKIIRWTLAFGIFSILVSVCIKFFQSELWNSIRYLTPEETFAKYPQYTVLFIIVSLFAICLMWILIYRIGDKI